MDFIPLRINNIMLRIFCNKWISMLWLYSMQFNCNINDRAFVLELSCNILSLLACKHAVICYHMLRVKVHIFVNTFRHLALVARCSVKLKNFKTYQCILTQRHIAKGLSFGFQRKRCICF